MHVWFQQYGLVFVSNETMGEAGDAKAALLTPEAANILSKAEGSLGLHSTSLFLISGNIEIKN